MARFSLFILCVFSSLLASCGGSGSDSDASMDMSGIDGGEPDAGAVDTMMPPPARPLFSFEKIVSGTDQSALIALTQPGETVDLLALTPTELWHLEIGAGSAEAVLTLTESFSPAAPPPSAARASDGTLHVVWEAIGVRYATNASGTWTESEIASSGRGVSLALDASGVPHVAFISLADQVNVARLEGDTWTTEVVASAPGGVGLPWAAIASEGERLVLAGTTGDGSFWLRVNEGAGWAEQAIDVGDVIFMGHSGEQTLTAGGGGTLLTFQSNGRYAAFRPAGATAFQVATLGNTYELNLDAPVGSAVGADGAFIAGQDFGERLAVVAPGAPYWPLVAAVPWDDCQVNIALSMDAGDNPIMATWCEGEIAVFRAEGSYPADFEARCDEAVTALCDRACACGSPDSECSYFVDTENHAGNRSGCMLAARESLCSDSSEPFETLLSCIATFDTPACDPTGYLVSEVCWPLRSL
jgi:hypothetical protein